jgi:NTE family protein
MVHKVMQIQSCLIAATEMASADVLIAPAINVSGISAKNEQDRAIQAGYKAARDSLSNIRTAIERWTDYL